MSKNVKSFAYDFVRDYLDIDPVLDSEWVVTLADMKKAVKSYCKQFRLKIPTPRELRKILCNFGVFQRSKNVKIIVKSVIDTRTGKNPTRWSAVRCWDGCKIKGTDGKLKQKYND